MNTLHRAILTAALASSAALAGSPMHDGMERRVQEVREGDVKYMCGGVGRFEAEYMKSAAADYDLALTFASRSGSYLADVMVSIADARGETVLRTTCGGPIMLVSLPGSGTYRIHATAAGHELTRTVNAGGKAHRSYVFRWPQHIDEGNRPAAPRA